MYIKLDPNRGWIKLFLGVFIVIGLMGFQDLVAQPILRPALRGPLIYHPFTLRLPGSPGDTLPPGPDVLFLVGIFDTGSAMVVINNIPYAMRDRSGQITKVFPTAADLFDLCGPTSPPRAEIPTCPSPQGNPPMVPGLKLLDVRVWGMDSYRQNAGIPIDNPQAEVKMVRVRPDDFRRDYFAGALIGTPIANQVIAYINYKDPITRTFFGNTLRTPSVTFYSHGDPNIPKPLFRVALTRFPANRPSPALRDQATQGQRYYMEDIKFRNGSKSVYAGQSILPDNSLQPRRSGSQSGHMPVKVLFDTGNSTTQITRSLAFSLGLELDEPCDSPKCKFFSTRDVKNQTKQLRCFRIDRVEMFANDQSYKHVIVDAPICVETGSQENLFHGQSSAILGSNYFENTIILFDGPGDSLGFYNGIRVQD